MQTEKNSTADTGTVRTERIQISHGRAIRVVSVFHRNGKEVTPEDKSRSLVDLELQQQRLCT